MIVRLILMTLLISFAGCSVHVSPLPGVDVRIPVPSPHNSDKNHGHD
jgi:hypothetical protein